MRSWKTKFERKFRYLLDNIKYTNIRNGDTTSLLVVPTLYKYIDTHNQSLKDFDVIQSAQSIKHLLLILKGSITRAWTKKIKEAMQRFVQATLDESNTNSICKRPMFKMDLKEEEPALIYLIQANEVVGIGEDDFLSRRRARKTILKL